MISPQRVYRLVTSNEWSVWSVPVEDQTLRDMAEYISEANRDDFLDKRHGGNKPVTVIVYQNGDQLNFFRIVDHDSNSPSESLR